MKTIVAATDGSAGAERAISFAANMAAKLATELAIITVGEERAGDEAQRFARAEHATVGDILESDAKKILARARELAERAGVRRITTHAEVGDPTIAILDRAKAVKADAIVAGKRGRGQLQGLLLGSVSQKLATLAPCAVVIVP